jgi:protein ImuA
MPESRISEAASGVVAAMPHAVWRASQMATFRTPITPTGFVRLDQELPNGGWPRSTLIELLPQQHGIGEIQLLAGALGPLSGTRRIALIQPPHIPQALACDALGLRADNLLWIKASKSADALWCAEQLLSTGDCCGALVMWQSQVRVESLRRLHLIAQSSDSYFWVVRPLAARSGPSPAPLRLVLRPAHSGVMIDVLKRRGPSSDEAIYLPLAGMPSSRHIEVDHANLDQRVFAATSARSAAPLLV